MDSLGPCRLPLRLGQPSCNEGACERVKVRGPPALIAVDNVFESLNTLAECPWRVGRLKKKDRKTNSDGTGIKPSPPRRCGSACRCLLPQ